ncbi:MAG: hypothetical protein JW829_14880, partial [Pirellulales bacterium]|nr:hypothetical protein [Pirellulales bacterium]
LEGPIPLREGDTFLLCSDGLTGPVSASEIGSILSCLAPEIAVQTLIDIANLRGGPDNITVVVVRVRHTTSKAETGSSDEDLPTTSVDTIPGSVHPVVWGAVFVLLLITMAFVALRQWIAAGATGIGFLLAMLIAWMQRMDRPRVVPPLAGPLGRGPYRKFDCNLSQEILDALAKITNELLDVAKDPIWKINRTLFESHCHEAQQAVEEGKLSQAIDAYCMAIRLIMKQVREQKQGDSNVT